MDNSAVMCDEVIGSCDDETKTVLKRFNGKDRTCKTQNFKYINKCIIKMRYKVKDVDIKNRTYYFFNDVIHIKSFDTKNFKIDEK